jgi:hypothetical protein
MYVLTDIVPVLPELIEYAVPAAVVNVPEVHATTVELEAENTLV